MSSALKNNSERRTALAIIAAMLTLTIGFLEWGMFRAGVADSMPTFLDFRAFYCSSAVGASGGDPYRA